MTPRSPLRPAQLDHLRIDADDAKPVVAFYRDALGFTPSELSDGSYVLAGRDRRLVVGPGTRGAQPYSAFRLQNARQLAALATYLEAARVPVLPSPSPLFTREAIAVRDPDGRLLVFGLPERDVPGSEASGGRAEALPARLQHFVVATKALAPMRAFYEDTLGFLPSDYVYEGEGKDREITAAFYRSDHEHHSFAMFRAPEARPDHHAYETTCWNDIRDWADHMASLEIPIWWGPGRHGPGNNLFFMVTDPQGYHAELSAELETFADDFQPRSWPHSERTLNLWGKAWMRS
jgi:catechol 2,3-dioxygenase-like lactoylglutathione lyase family enzyme